MKTTFTSTKRFDDLSKATFKLYIYDEPKYGRDFDANVIERIYTDVVSFDIIGGGEEAKEIEKEMAPDFDVYSEYLILHFEDGSQATFRYSYVDMYILKEHVIYGGLKNNAIINQLEHISKAVGVLHSI